MSNSVTFDDFNSEDLGHELLDPFPFIKYEDPAQLLEWCKQEMDNRKKGAESRMRYYRRNLALYKGVHYKNVDMRNDNRDEQEENIRKPKMVVNFIQEMTDAKVAKLSMNKASLVVIPQDDDFTSKNEAKAVKSLVDNRYDQVDIDATYAKADMVRFLLGHQWTFALWNPEAGELHPSFLKLKKKAETDPEAKKRLKKLESEEVRVGDVDYTVMGPDLVFPQMNKREWKDVDDIMYVEWKPLKEVQADYPKIADSIILDDEDFMYDYDTLQVRKLNNYIKVVHYYHRDTKYLRGGRYVKFTTSAILENMPLPYNHGRLPCAQSTDIDVYNELFGRSFIQNILQLQRHFNNIASGIARNHGIASAPKWMMPKGACSTGSLNNELTVVEFRGAIAPKLVTFNPTPSEVFMYQDKLEKWIEKGSTIYGISRGEPPKGVTASVAMQFLDEQEQQRDSKRTVRILGEDNKYMIKSFGKTDFSVFYDVKVQNASALPDTKSGKIQSIIDLNNATNTAEEGPVFRRAEIIGMLDLGLDETFKEQAQVNVKVAESVVEAILQGEEVPEPQIYDDFLEQYPIFMRTLQSRTFKEQVPSPVQVKLIQHIKTMEGLMWERAIKNQTFAMKIQMRSDFPVFFKPLQVPPPVVETPPQKGGQAGAAAKRDAQQALPAAAGQKTDAEMV